LEDDLNGQMSDFFASRTLKPCFVCDIEFHHCNSLLDESKSKNKNLLPNFAHREVILE
jgi:hypothetical protein